MCKASFTLCGLILLGLVVVHSRIAHSEIAVWAGNSRDWNERLGISVIRQACDLEPAPCVERLRKSAEAQSVPKWILAITRDARKIERYAQEYGQLSAIERRLIEIDIDDFVGTLTTWQMSKSGKAYDILTATVTSLKAGNSELQFGVTLYEDELARDILTSIPSNIRATVNRVALYQRYRSSAMQFPLFVSEAKKLFPNATVWAGSYSYDRIDYLPCAVSGIRNCSKGEEFELFEKSLRLQLDLLRGGEIAGIEFYPGHFGREDVWSGWRAPRICSQDRVQECIDVTIRLRNIVVTVMGEFGLIER